MNLLSISTTLLTLLTLSTGLPNPDPVQPFHPTQNGPNPSQPVSTIPAFPEQSDVSGCPLDLPQDLFTNVKSACTSRHISPHTCCPVLAAWLYSAYSATALHQTTSYYDLPLLPNDSETCTDGLESRLRSNGVELKRRNETCDVVYCECGIRLRQLVCEDMFKVSSVGVGVGGLVGNHVVKRLEKDCLNGCSTCLKTLRLLNTSKSEERSSKMHNEDCELMGLTWLLAKNRSAYIHTVSGVLRARMMNTESCTDGLPLAVDSTEINASSALSSSLLHLSLAFSLLLFLMLNLPSTI